MRKPLIAGNWKMNLTPLEAESLITSLTMSGEKEAELLICPPFIDLPIAEKELAGSFIQLGAQNMYPEDKGAFTGEVSPVMLTALSCRYVICGHSERRFILEESNEFIAQKVKSAMNHGLIPILCVGEIATHRKQGKAEEIIRDEIKTAFSSLTPDEVAKVVVAYEPVWAIGTGVPIEASQAELMAQFIRNEIKAQFGEKTSECVRILYGGSVNASNIVSFMEQENIDGALIGGASLKADEFISIYSKV